MRQWRFRIKLSVLLIFLFVSPLILADAFMPTTLGARVESVSNPGLTEPASPLADSRQDPPPEQPGAENYVGPETCRACHPDQYAWYARTAHFATIRSERFVPPVKGCEMCHGPGLQHVQAGGQGNIFNPRTASARQVVAMCTNCHQEKRLGKCGFHENQHNVEIVACTECHNPHQEETYQYILRMKSPGLCLECHREIRAEFSRPFHHKVPEGGMDCRDCHQQHGSFNLTQTVETVGGLSALCVRCHTDKEGPFVFEHISTRLDRCLACHVPHGSINNRMLIRSEVRLLCQECHGARQGASADAPQGFHDLTTPRYQNCTSCHLMIHGSNTSRLFFR